MARTSRVQCIMQRTIGDRIFLCALCVLLVSVGIVLAQEDDSRGPGRTQQQKIAALTTWLRANGVRMDSIAIGQSALKPASSANEDARSSEGEAAAAGQEEEDDGMLGVFSTRLLLKGDEVLHVPFEVMLSEAAMDESELSHVLARAGTSLSLTDQMALFLLYEDQQRDSFWRTYLDLLPSSISTPLFYSDEELEVFEGSVLTDFVAARKAQADAAYEKAIAPLVADHEDDFDRAISRHEWYWALSVLWSRCFSMHINGMDQGALVPLADMMNSAPVHLEEEHQQVEVKRDRNGLTLVAKKTIEAGEEILVPYKKEKQRSNAEILFDYGYVQEDNPFKSMLVVVPEMEALSEKRKRLFQELLLASREVTHVRLEAGKPPIELMWLAQIVHMTEGEVARELRSLKGKNGKKPRAHGYANKGIVLESRVNAFALDTAKEWLTRAIDELHEIEERKHQSRIFHRIRAAVAGAAQRVLEDERESLKHAFKEILDQLWITSENEEQPLSPDERKRFADMDMIVV
eukprot:TRINITY_DN4435_c0_g1_i1.p1 TRINITY_DN4435_c0_g1~~TRINITY_DN4435_c0_g1_i1.p1  ORF type:complete len:519 (+),score=172.02 TRINITY_DN4435_c0_g1_i1:111-1667(+)